jgi:hypothetical protein
VAGSQPEDLHWIIGVTYMQKYFTIYKPKENLIGIIEANKSAEILDSATVTEYIILIISILLIISGCCGGCCCGFRPCRTWYKNYSE